MSFRIFFVPLGVAKVLKKSKVFREILPPLPWVSRSGILQRYSHRAFHVPLEDLEGSAFEVGAEVIGLGKDAEDPYLVPVGCGKAGVDVEGYLTMLGMFFARDYRHAVDLRPGGILVLIGPVVFTEF